MWMIETMFCILAVFALLALVWSILIVGIASFMFLKIVVTQEKIRKMEK